MIIMEARQLFSNLHYYIKDYQGNVRCHVGYRGAFPALACDVDGLWSADANHGYASGAVRGGYGADCAFVAVHDVWCVI